MCVNEDLVSKKKFLFPLLSQISKDRGGLAGGKHWCSIKISLDWGGWKEKPQPWGCPYAYLLLSKAKQFKIIEGEIEEYDVKNYTEHCDECPVQNICPNASHYSQ